jgi:hypothetical protein
LCSLFCPIVAIDAAEATAFGAYAGALTPRTLPVLIAPPANSFDDNVSHQ